MGVLARTSPGDFEQVPPNDSTTGQYGNEFLRKMHVI